MRAKAQAIVDAAQESGCSIAVLSAFGCGAYANPPAEVAQFFWDALWPVGMDTPLQGVVFCTFEDHNAG
eukprot:12301947-Alexandrium_andersonii.AAC.1